MKLMFGALSYLAVVGTLLAVSFAGIFGVDRIEQKDTPVFAHASEDSAQRKARALEEVRADPDRVPVWIVATPKYEYTPVAVTQPKARTFIGGDARAAMANDRIARDQDGLSAIDGALGREARGTMRRSLGFAPTRRDNDPFFRD
jgi:hypothetical protein